jgi:hypothetical protein
MAKDEKGEFEKAAHQSAFSPETSFRFTNGTKKNQQHENRRNLLNLIHDHKATPVTRLMDEII